MADSFLVFVPHKTLHGTISILIQRPKLATNVGKIGGSQKQNAFHPPNALVPHKVQPRRCRGTASLASLPCSTGKA